MFNTNIRFCMIWKCVPPIAFNLNLMMPKIGLLKPISAAIFRNVRDRIVKHPAITGCYQAIDNIKPPEVKNHFNVKNVAFSILFFRCQTACWVGLVLWESECLPQRNQFPINCFEVKFFLLFAKHGWNVVLLGEKKNRLPEVKKHPIAYIFDLDLIFMTFNSQIHVVLLFFIVMVATYATDVHVKLLKKSLLFG